MRFQPPEWDTGDPVSMGRLVALAEAINWQRERGPAGITLTGSRDAPAYGKGEIVDYLTIDPASYPGYVGHPGPWGAFTVNLPDLLAELRTVSLVPASGDNGALALSVSAESESSISVFAFDSGGSNLLPFAIWLNAAGPLKAGKIPAGLTPSYGLPILSPFNALTHTALNHLGQSISWLHNAGGYCFDLAGAQVSNQYGLADVTGYLYVDPAAYAGYLGHPGPLGQFNVSLPAGLFSSLECVQLQVASGANGALQASVRSESTAGFTVFVYDSGGTSIFPFALWLRVRGKLNQGKLVTALTPAFPDRSFGLINWTATTEITSAGLQKYTDSLYWRIRRLPFLIDLDGTVRYSRSGYGLVEGYLPVNPFSYQGYAGAGAYFGHFRLMLPEGILENLDFIRVQPASGTNRMLVSTVSAETPGGVSVFVYDCGETSLSAFAVWVTAIGELKAGVLP